MRKKEFREVQPDRTINSFQGNIVRFSGGRDGRVGEQESSVKRFYPPPLFPRVVLYSRDGWFRVEDRIIMLNDITYMQWQKLRYSPCNRPRRPRRWMRSTATGSKGPRFRAYTSSGNKCNVCQ